MKKDEVKAVIQRLSLLLSFTNRAIEEVGVEKTLGDQRDRLNAQIGLLNGKLKGKATPKAKK